MGNLLAKQIEPKAIEYTHPQAPDVSKSICTNYENRARWDQEYAANNVGCKKDAQKFEWLIFVLHHHFIKVFCIGVFDIDNYQDEITDQ